MNALRVGILIVFIALVGCSSGGSGFKADTFSDKDMCIVQTEGDTKICYGDKRADAEKVLGSGDEDESGITNFTSYENGISLVYRDDVIAAIALGEGSEGKYKTARGAEVGMTKDKVKSLYGKKNAVEAGKYNLDYAYDSKNKKYVSDLRGQPKEELLQTYTVSMMINDEGSASTIMLLDRKYAMTLS